MSMKNKITWTILIILCLLCIALVPFSIKIDDLKLASAGSLTAFLLGQIMEGLKEQS